MKYQEFLDKYTSYQEFLDRHVEENQDTRWPPHYLMSSVEQALKEAQEYGDFRPLSHFLEMHPEEVAVNKEACKLIATLLRGEVTRGTGKRGAYKKYTEIRDYQILKMIYFFKGYGFPVRSDYGKDDDACSIACRGIERMGLISLSYDRVVDIWKAHKREYAPAWERHKPKCTPIRDQEGLEKFNKAIQEQKTDAILDGEYFRGKAVKRFDKKQTKSK